MTISMVHLPAVNTPQFDWSTARLPKHPQPVPPIYQPEVAAEAILEAVRDGRRSTVLGSWNKLIVAAAGLAPGVLNHYAARTGVQSQQTDQRLASDRPANLHAPDDAHDDYGAHGRFDDRAGGVLDPSFVRALPHTLQSAAGAVADAARFRMRTAGRR